MTMNESAIQTLIEDPLAKEVLAFSRKRGSSGRSASGSLKLQSR